jgi:hypothetical protein
MVWPDAMVTENALKRTIGLLRKSLNDDTHVQRFIETVPTAGYRFIAKVTVLEESPVVEPMSPAAANPPADEHGKGAQAKRWIFASAIASFVAVGFAAYMTPSPVSGPLDSTQVTFSAEAKQGPLFTDGSRLYSNGREEPSEMSVTGGSIVPMRLLRPDMSMLDISADASKALALKTEKEDNIGRGT